MVTPEQRLVNLGIELPPTPSPVAAYITAIRYGNLVQTAGQLPRQPGGACVTGKLGETLSAEEGKRAARLACLNALAAAKGVLGSLNEVERVVSLVVYVQSANAFSDQPLVANGASELLEVVFGESGRHVRAAVGVNALPMNACVELTLTVEARAK